MLLSAPHTAAHIIIAPNGTEKLRLIKTWSNRSNPSFILVLTVQTSAEQQIPNIFLVEPKNPNMSTRMALLRAQQLLGGRQAEISIYATEKASA